ncbi:MAG: hypothetical protein WC027_03245 [Candidatus Paceibacterota bacterium]
MKNKFEGQNISLLAEPLRLFSEGDPTLRLNRLIQKLHKTEVFFDENSSASVTHRENNLNTVRIGAQPYSDELVKRWNMGTVSPEEQRFVKLAHELAHAFQTEKGYEKSLVDFLNGENNIPDSMIPYIELYALLSGIGPVNPLSVESIYKEQSKRSGHLKMETLEDITELISAYIISDDYFLARLENSMMTLSDEQKELVAKKVIEVCRDLH